VNREDESSGFAVVEVLVIPHSLQASVQLNRRYVGRGEKLSESVLSKSLFVALEGRQLASFLQVFFYNLLKEFDSCNLPKEVQVSRSDQSFQV
jgi:hypothetical protein